MSPDDIAILIPAINEQASIAAAIESARAAGATEIIVCDGGSDDRTAEIATRSGAAKLVRTLPGRGTQLQGGVRVCEKDWLLFLHADNRLDHDCLKQICQHPKAIWGAFRQRIDSSRKIFRVIERGNALRVKVRGMAFGDQAIFVRRSTLVQQGGVAEIPLMEDVELSLRLRRVARPLLLPGPVTISARRWEQQGVVRQTLRNWSIQLAYKFGACPEELRRRYR